MLDISILKNSILENIRIKIYINTENLFFKESFLLVDASWSSWTQSACFNPNIVGSSRAVKKRTRTTQPCTEGADTDDLYACQTGY